MSTSDTATYSSSASRIGDRIRRIRTERGMSRAELGEKVNLCQIICMDGCRNMKKRRCN